MHDPCRDCDKPQECDEVRCAQRHARLDYIEELRKSQDGLNREMGG